MPTHTLIATHDGADFDAFAAQVAARKLHPGSVLLRSPSLGRDVHPYLALHADHFGGRSVRQVSWSQVRRLIVVDVRRQSRLGHIGPLLERRRSDPGSLEVIIYDHHPSHPDDLRGDEEHVEPVGSTTTLLTELLEAGGVGLDRVEATLLALGIHADTGSLSFLHTGPRDARALAFLLESGAECAMLGRYLHAPLDVARRQALANVLAAAEIVTLGGLQVGIAALELNEKLSGLDEVTTRAHDLLGCHALFAIYQMTPRKLQVVGRSRAQPIDVAAVLSSLGGGGHASAGAAALHQTDIAATKESLLAALRRRPPVGVTARDLMSSPVHRVSPETPLRELARKLAEWRHSGACVVRDGRAIAVISQSDVLRAEQAGQLDLRVKTFMSSRLVSTAPDASLERVLELMERNNVGRLPVLDRGHVIGIVTRSDVLRELYREKPEEVWLGPGQAAPFD